MGLKERSGRLSVFARGSSDPVAALDAPDAHDAPAPVEVRPATPQQQRARAPNRQDLADAARLPVPVRPRIVAAVAAPAATATAGRDARDEAPVPQAAPPPPQQKQQKQQQQQSPATPRRRLRDAQERNAELFSGSQLGEGFMRSGLSTPQPQPEPDDAAAAAAAAAAAEDEADVEADVDVTPNAKRHSEPALNGRFDQVVRRFPTRTAASFAMDDKGMMAVVDANQRLLPRHMMDGFRDDGPPFANKRPALGHAPWPALPPLQSQPPPAAVRQVRVRKPPAPAPSVVAEEDPPSRSPTPSPTAPAVKRQGRRTGPDHGLQQAYDGHDRDWDDDGAESANGDYDEQPPPRQHQCQHHHHHQSRTANESARRPAGPAPSTQPNMAQQRQPRDRKRRRVSPDYDDQTLSTMTYRDLQEEPFDGGDARVGGHGGRDAAAAKLPARLAQYRHQGEREQVHMFAAMSTDDWEAAGDWFVDHFADMMKRLRRARRDKRRVVAEFEDEAASREEAVRLRSDAIDKKLAWMRKEGQRVVQDKGL